VAHVSVLEKFLRKDPHPLAKYASNIQQCIQQCGTRIMRNIHIRNPISMKTVASVNCALYGAVQGKRKESNGMRPAFIFAQMSICDGVALPSPSSTGKFGSGLC
jgi:hypothetical protein